MKSFRISISTVLRQQLTNTFKMAAPAGFSPGYRCFYRLLQTLLNPRSGSKRSQHL